MKVTILFPKLNNCYVIDPFFVCFKKRAGFASYIPPSTTRQQCMIRSLWLFYLQ